MICHYVNNQAGLIGPGGALNAIPDLFFRPSRFYHNMLTLPGGHILAAFDLRRIGITAQVFLQIQYFFLPMALQAHWSLVVISPRDRTVEILDSTSTQHNNWPHRAENVFVKVFQFLEYFLRALFVPAQWQTMHDQSPQQAADDNISCGTFVCRFAMSIACREHLDPETYQNQYLWGQRARIAREILHGRFTGN